MKFSIGIRLLAVVHFWMQASHAIAGDNEQVRLEGSAIQQALMGVDGVL